ncbi:MAG: HAMP domain-containing sensor histidine kinase [Myxococcota bacterium]
MDEKKITPDIVELERPLSRLPLHAKHILDAIVRSVVIGSHVTAVGFWMCNLDTGDTWVSDTVYLLCGLDPEQKDDLMSLKTYLNVIQDNDRSVVEQAMRRSMETGWFEAEYTLEPSSGEARRLRSIGRVQSLDGHRWHTGMMIDVTSERQLEAELARAQMSPNPSLAVLSHDLNNVFQVIQASLDMLPLVSPEEQHEMLDHLHHRLNQAQTMLKASRSKISPTYTLLSLRTFILHRQEQLQQMMGSSIRVVCETDADPCSIYADAQQLEKALWDLALNARRAMPLGGTLTLSTVQAPDRGWVRLCVSDDGVGMDDDTQHNAFKPYFSTHEDHVGLGLVAVQWIVQWHGGRLTLDSAPNEGTTMIIDLPRASIKEGRPLEPSAQS